MIRQNQPSRRTGIALGSNFGDRLQNLRTGADRVAALAVPGSEILRSRIYETEPVDCAPDTAPFLNAVMEIECALDPETLLAELQKIETDLGRPTNHGHNTPRTIDLDILYTGDIVCEKEYLSIPHPRITERRFVLEPLAEIRPELILPSHRKPISELLHELPQ
jgi:2-amino-4-hydroxy-6-hydroxymethyldihydropteridine diphosphokinase